MKRNLRYCLLLTLCLLAVFSVAMLCSCDDDPETPAQITVTVNVNLEGVSNQTFTADKDEDGEASFYGKLASYLPQETGGLVFAGWRDSNGSAVTESTRWSSDGAVIAQWNANYAVEYYLQTDEGYVKSNQHSVYNTALLGSAVSAERLTIEGYVFDESNELNVTSATLKANTTLKLYYKRAMVTVTFVANNPNAQGTMDKQTVPFNASTKLNDVAFVWNNDDRSDFGGWNTEANGMGDYYSDGCSVILTEDLTLYGQWKVAYTEEIWVEKFDGSNYVYVLEKTVTQQGFLGNAVSLQSVLTDEDYERLGHNRFFRDEEQNTEEAELSTESLKENDKLAVFYSIERFAVIYADDNARVEVRYGQEYAIRDVEEDVNSHVVVVSYSTDVDGDGREYYFGREITIDGNLTLYPVYARVFNDAEGSGDRVVIRSNVEGLGSAKLIKDGVGYLGYVNVQTDVVTFDVNVNGVDVYGKLYSDDTFLYRLEEEVGVYLYGDHLFPDYGVYPDLMLALDGYGVGALSVASGDGTDRTLSYVVNYVQTEDGDYYMEYYAPSAPTQVLKGYFLIVREAIEGAEDLPNVVGYFLLCGEEYGDYIYAQYGDYDVNCMLGLDGYGQGVVTRYGDNREILSQVTGEYRASDRYTDEAPEYLFVPFDSAQESFTFILISEQNPNTGEYVYFFMIKQDEEGVYHLSADDFYPELYLDGYGMASYVDVENGDERLGTYVLAEKDGNLEVTVSFADTAGGSMRVQINKTDKIYVPASEFEIEANVLVAYHGSDSVIVVPEGVVEIADGVFKDKNITTLTLPFTLTKIGDYAFQNSSVGGKSAIKTVYINAVTPPTLGEDPFRWVTTEFKIIVPNGSEQTYRDNEGWKREYDSAVYADYVTSLAELADKPEFEVKDGVLLSYNNKDDNHVDIAITIPDEVTEIADGVFEGRQYIVSVNLNNVTVIGDSAFDSCEGLTSVTFNAQTELIGSYAFYGCLGLTSVNLGNVKQIGDMAFAMCWNLTEVNVGSRIRSVGQQAFAYCAIEVDQEENITKQNDLLLTVTAEEAPEMSVNVFRGSVPRIYVNSYEVGVVFANGNTWTLYANSLRVKAESSLTLYSLANMGAELILADNALFDQSRSGLYKWENGKLYIAWFDRDEYSNQFAVIRQVGELDESAGIIRGFTLYDNDPLAFVTAGSTVNYVGGNGETLSVTFGSSNATFNGNAVTMEIVNYRMQFTYEGYVYKLTLAVDKTFTYKRDKVVTTATYTAENGSSLTVSYGNIVQATGTIKNVDGNGLDITVQYMSVILTEIADNTYTFVLQWRNDKYLVTATLDKANLTFTYFVGEESTSAKYDLDGDYADYVVVTTFVSGKIDVELHFATANGELSCKCVNVQAVEGQSGAYSINVAIAINVYDELGNKIGERPSEFNGDYILVLNDADSAYVLVNA